MSLPSVAVFITVFMLLCIFCLIFVCYRAGRDGRLQALERTADEAEAAAMQRATLVLSIVPGGAAGIQPYNNSSSRASARSLAASRKMPTPPTIVRNLPIVVWDQKPRPPKAASAAPAAAQAAAAADTARRQQDNDIEEGEGTCCIICCCEYQQGETVKFLPCLHHMHELCIDAWLERSHVCPVCQADVIQAAGLSAAAGDWSVHTMDAINTISGVQQQQPPTNSSSSTTLQQAATLQQQQQQQVAAGPGSGPHTANSSSTLHPVLPVSSPPLSPAGAAALLAPPPPASSGHSTDAIAVVVAGMPASAAPGCTVGAGGGSGR